MTDRTASHAGDAAPPDDGTLRAWLLHRLDAEASERLEQRLFTDAGFADRIDGVLADLYDDAARGRLPPADVRRLRQRDAARWRFSRAFARAPRPRFARPHAPWLRAAAALAASLLLAVLAWRTMPLRPGASLPADAAGLPVAALFAEQSRGGDAPLLLPAAPAGLRLQAEVDADDAASVRYQLRVEDAGQPRFVAAALVARTVGRYRFVEVVVPADRLGAGLHTVTLARDSAGAPALRHWTVQAVAGNP